MNKYKRYKKIFEKPEIIFVILATIFGITSAILVPQLSANDEGMHMLRAYALADGDLDSSSCVFPAEVKQKFDNASRDAFETSYDKTIDNAKPIESSCGSAGSYPPLMHLPQALGMWLGSIINNSTASIVLFGRLFNLIFYIIALYFIIKLSLLGKWIIVVIATFPLMIHTASSLSSDVFNNVIVFAFVVFIFNLFVRKESLTRIHYSLLLIFPILLASTKVTNVVLLLLAAFLPSRLFLNQRSYNSRFVIKKWILVGIMFGLFVFFVFLWQQINNTPLPGSASDNPLMENPLKFLNVLSNTYINPFIGYNDIVLRGVVGEFSSFKYHLPTFMVVVSFVLLFITLLHSNKKEEKMFALAPKSFAVITSITFLIFILITSYALYVSWAIQPYRLGPNAIYIDGIQGRYFTATLVLLIPLFIWIRKYLSFETKKPLSIGLVVFSLSFLLLLFYSVQTYQFLASI